MRACALQDARGSHSSLQVWKLRLFSQCVKSHLTLLFFSKLWLRTRRYFGFCNRFGDCVRHSAASFQILLQKLLPAAGKVLNCKLVKPATFPNTNTKRVRSFPKFHCIGIAFLDFLIFQTFFVSGSLVPAALTVTLLQVRPQASRTKYHSDSYSVSNHRPSFRALSFSRYRAAAVFGTSGFQAFCYDCASGFDTLAITLIHISISLSAVSPAIPLSLSLHPSSPLPLHLRFVYLHSFYPSLLHRSPLDSTRFQYQL